MVSAGIEVAFKELHNCAPKAQISLTLVLLVGESVVTR